MLAPQTATKLEGGKARKGGRKSHFERVDHLGTAKWRPILVSFLLPSLGSLRPL